MKKTEAELSIAFVTHSLDRGGSPISLWQLAHKLDKCRRVLVSEKDGPLRERFESAGIEVRILPRGGFLQLDLIRRFTGLFREFGPDLVHLNTLTSYYKYPALAARGNKIPVVWFIREDVRERRCRKLHWWIKNLATRIVPVSEEIARNLYPRTIPPKVRVIHNGIDPTPILRMSPSLRAQLDLSTDAPVVGCVAALEPRKGVADLVDAIAELKRQEFSVNLVCLGKDRSRSQSYRKMLETKIRAARLEHNVFLLGDNANPLAVYGEFDVFVLPTSWEGCARTLLEAMLARCPIITTDAGGNPEIISHNQTGMLVKPGDVSALAAAIKTLLSDPLRAKKLAATAHEDLLRRFTLNRHVENVLNVYDAALASRKRKRS